MRGAIYQMGRVGGGDRVVGGRWRWKFGVVRKVCTSVGNAECTLF